MLARFYHKYSPDKGEDHIVKIIESGMELSYLNQKLKDKYGADLDDFAIAEGIPPLQ